MSGHYFYGEIVLENEARAEKLCQIIDYENISKLYKGKPSDERQRSGIPRVFTEESENYCQFERCDNDGENIYFTIDADYELTEQEELNKFGKFLSEFGAKKGTIAYHYSGADFNPIFFEYFGGNFNIVYNIGDNSELDEILLSNDASSLEEVFHNIKSNNIILKPIIKPEEHFKELVAETLSKLKAPELFGNTPIIDLPTAQYLANSLREPIAKKLGAVDDETKSLLEEFVYETHCAAVKMTLEALYSCNVEMRVNDIDINGSGTDRLNVYFE